MDLMRKKERILRILLEKLGKVQREIANLLVIQNPGGFGSIH
jgi:hypothetical protein